MSKYEDKTKEELIEILEQVEKRRAFSYIDQLKLLILDKSPFTVWASDRNCIIRLWEGQCESMYGRKKEEVIGKDFVDLFVAKDEQAAARRDQLEIIDNNKEYHNIANDKGRNGNNLQLITNCFRVRDPQSGEYWNAEMGVAIDFYEEEKIQLQLNIEEGKLINSLINDFDVIKRRYIEQFNERKESLFAEINITSIEAIRQKKLKYYKELILPVKNSIEIIEENINNLIMEYSNKILNCTSSSECKNLKIIFNKELNKILNEFDDVVLSVEEINSEFADIGIISMKDEIMKMTTNKNAHLEMVATEVWLKAENAIKEYLSLGKNCDENSPRLKMLKSHSENISLLKIEINKIADEVYSKLNYAKTEEEIIEIKTFMETKYKEVQLKLDAIRGGISS